MRTAIFCCYYRERESACLDSMAWFSQNSPKSHYLVMMTYLQGKGGMGCAVIVWSQAEVCSTLADFVGYPVSCQGALRNQS
eukprot:973870-Amphidinium_carterae.1